MNTSQKNKLADEAYVTRTCEYVHGCESKQSEIDDLQERLRHAELREKWGSEAAKEECVRWHRSNKPTFRSILRDILILFKLTKP